jgi:hypothetical protein
MQSTTCSSCSAARARIMKGSQVSRSSAAHMIYKICYYG